MKAQSTYKLLPVMEIRNDTGGSGLFGASREGGKRTHRGTDYTVYKGQSITAPETGIIVRRANPYPNDPKYKGLLFKGESGREIKVFYAEPNETLIGKKVKAGQVIAKAQNIGEKYSNVTPHIHVEVYRSGILINPQTIF